MINFRTVTYNRFFNFTEISYFNIFFQYRFRSYMRKRTDFYTLSTVRLQMPAPARGLT